MVLTHAQVQSGCILFVLDVSVHEFKCLNRASLHTCLLVVIRLGNFPFSGINHYGEMLLFDTVGVAAPTQYSSMCSTVCGLRGSLYNMSLLIL